MSDFHNLTDDVLASPQITVADVARAKTQGVTLIVNNRPEGESADQTSGEDIEKAAQAAGINYVAIRVTHAGFSLPQIDALSSALAANRGKTLAYCRSGTRSTLLWALARAKAGDAPDAIAAAAAQAGYDVAPVRPTMDMLAGRASD